MKIAVCIKRTPDSESRFKVGASTTGVDETGLKFDMDDFASYAVEVALQTNEKQGPGEGVAVAKALAAELKSGAFDLIFFGKYAFDSSASIVGTATAELLGVPCVTAASKLEIANGRGTARREIEGAGEMVEFPLPAVVTIDEGIARPRYPSLKGIMAAKKKPLESRPAQLGPVRVSVKSMELPPDRPPGRIVGQGAAAVPELVRLLQN